MAKYTNIAEAFNAYNGQTIEQMEKRAAEIAAELEQAGADIPALSVELRGIQEAKANHQEKQLRSLGSMNVETRSFDAETVRESAEFRSAFWKTMQGKKLSEVEQRAFNAAASSASVIPEQTLNEILVAARKRGGLLSLARNFALPAHIRVPIAAPGQAAAWHTEGAEVEAGSVAVNHVTFDANEIVKILSVSKKTDALAISAFEAFIQEELQEAVASTIADCLVNGTGAAGQGQGILAGITWNGDNTVTAEGEITYKDIVELFALLPGDYAQNAHIVMNRATLYRDVYGMTGADEKPVFIADPKNEKIGYVLSVPVVLDEHLPAGTILLGDFKKAIGVNIPNGIRMSRSEESSFKTNLIDYKIETECDTRVLLQDAVVKLVKA